jgi:putative tryptophan/tyrosine transport system substrate-binding protein
MDRRAFMSGVTVSLLAAPLAAGAQLIRVYRVAYVNRASETPERKPHLQAFRDVMRSLGYVEGLNLLIDARWADGKTSRVPALVDEVIALRPDVLLGFEQVVQVMRMKTTSIPIVLTGAFDPVKAGLAQSLRRPGVNVTGSTQLNDELPGKHIEIMRQILSRLVRVGLLVDTTASGCKLLEEQVGNAARSLGARLVPYYVSSREEVARAFSQMANDRPDMLLPCPSSVLFSSRNLLFEGVLRLRIPLTSFVVPNTPLGVLFSHAATVEEGYRRAAIYVAKILKGAYPGDLSIEQPTTFQLVINLKTAKALGLSIPQSLLLRADEVIQ